MAANPHTTNTESPLDRELVAELCSEGRVLLVLLDDWKDAGLLNHIRYGGPAHQSIEAFRAALAKTEGR